MKVLVIGGGGREHAIAWKISKSPRLTKLYCAPGNAGTRDIAENVDIGSDSMGALAVWAVQNEIDLTVVGPEAPLAEGLVDVFTEHGLKVFGPTKEAAQLESSKAFAKEVMIKAGVRTAKGEAFEDLQAAKRYVEECGAPIVIKADGLAAGKGVLVAETLDEALNFIDSLMDGDRFGSAGKRVVIEEKLDGREASIMAMVDEDTVLPLVVSQDYKRLLDGQQGPNTGGMGAISPTPVLEDAQVEPLVNDIFLPVIRELWGRGIRYTGFLYAGVMVDRSGGVKVLEFNCRLGDPETQVIMPRLQSDLLVALDAAVHGKLSNVELKWTNKAAATIVAASAGYPGTVDDGKVIEGMFDDGDDVQVFQAGTAVDPSRADIVKSKGGRVLAVSALGATTSDAVAAAYEGLGRISFDGMQHRSDIGREE